MSGNTVEPFELLTGDQAWAVCGPDGQHVAIYASRILAEEHAADLNEEAGHAKHG